MTKRICIFQVDLSIGSATLQSSGLDMTRPAWTILRIESSSGEHELPHLGYRLYERNAEGATRPGPWIVTKLPQSFAATQDQKVDEVYLFECTYQPLAVAPEWESCKTLQVPPQVANEIGMEASKPEHQLI